jgi:2-polyprenyl-3-methyl-5-hydroxy-6-metoxy-1,4-benzoquinol methylase
MLAARGRDLPSVVKRVLACGVRNESVATRDMTESSRAKLLAPSRSEAAVALRRGWQVALSRLKYLVRRLSRLSGFEVRRLPKRKESAAGYSMLTPATAEIVEQAKSRFSVSLPISPHCSLAQAEIEERLDSFYWHYPFEFGGRFVEADWEPGKGIHGRHYRRYLHIFPALLSMRGGSLTGATVLDVGCNCGFWSLQARRLGAESVLGIEASQENVDQANFILELTGIGGIRFEQGSAYEVSRERHGEFDVVLYLGLLYHLEHPVLALERLYETTAELAVVDTTVVPDSGVLCRIQADVVHDQNYSNRLAFVPSRAAVAAMLRHVGFRKVVLVPNAPATPPPDYESGRRATFIAQK